MLGILFLTDLAKGQDLPTACGNGKVRYRMRGQPGSTFEWSVQGGSILAVHSKGDSVDVKWDNLPGQHSLSCQEYVVKGCYGPPVIRKVNVEVLSLGLADSTYLCKGESVTLSVNGGFSKYLWGTGSQRSSIQVTQPGIYWVEAIKGKCVIKDTVKVIGLIPPVVYLGKDTMLNAYEKILLDAKVTGMSYLWSTGSKTRSIWANEGDGEIWVVVADDKNCMASDTIKLLPYQTDKLIIPNVFTPNGDGVNDDWRIGGLLNYPNVNVKLFDRWGRLIFNSEPGYPRPWNGERNGKPLPMDAYFYIIDLKDGSEPIRGSVSLIP